MSASEKRYFNLFLNFIAKIIIPKLFSTLFHFKHIQIIHFSILFKNLQSIIEHCSSNFFLSISRLTNFEMLLFKIGCMILYSFKVSFLKCGRYIKRFPYLTLSQPICLNGVLQLQFFFPSS